MAQRLIDALTKKNGGNQSELARFVQVSPQAVQKWIAGESEPRGANLTRAAQFLGVTPAYLKFGTGIEDIAHALPQDYAPVVPYDNDNPEFVEIRKVKLSLQAGIVGFAVESEVVDGRPISYNRHWLQEQGLDPKDLIAIKVKGESMEPSLYEGDTVVINTADRIPKDGVAFAINYEGESVVKRMERDVGEWWLSSDNPDKSRYSRKICRGKECIIIGRIVQKQSLRI